MTSVSKTVVAADQTRKKTLTFQKTWKFWKIFQRSNFRRRSDENHRLATPFRKNWPIKSSPVSDWSFPSLIFQTNRGDLRRSGTIKKSVDFGFLTWKVLSNCSLPFQFFSLLDSILVKKKLQENFGAFKIKSNHTTPQLNQKDEVCNVFGHPYRRGGTPSGFWYVFSLFFPLFPPSSSEVMQLIWLFDLICQLRESYNLICRDFTLSVSCVKTTKFFPSPFPSPSSSEVIDLICWFNLIHHLFESTE